MKTKELTQYGMEVFRLMKPKDTTLCSMLAFSSVFQGITMKGNKSRQSIAHAICHIFQASWTCLTKKFECLSVFELITPGKTH